jgi:hypothetical protein
VAERQNHFSWLRELYRDDADPGIHGAAEWLLRKWEMSDDLKTIDKGLATGKVEGKRQWYINRQGQTMMVIPTPGEFWMFDGNQKHRRKIDRSFAIASKEVTVDQFRRFRKEHQWSEPFAPNLLLEILRFQMRLAKDLQCLKVESYGFAAKAIDEIGKLVGGWLKSGSSKA